MPSIRIVARNPSLDVDQNIAPSAAVAATERSAKARLDSIKQAIERRRAQKQARSR